MIVKVISVNKHNNEYNSKQETNTITKIITNKKQMQ